MAGGIRFLTFTSTPWVIWQYDWIDPSETQMGTSASGLWPISGWLICGGDGESVSYKGVYPESVSSCPKLSEKTGGNVGRRGREKSLSLSREEKVLKQGMEEVTKSPAALGWGRRSGQGQWLWKC